MLWTPLACIFALTLSGPQDPGAGSPTAPNWLLETAGSWTGHLEYRDFGTDRTVRIPARLEASIAPDRSFASWGLTLSDPGKDRWSMTIATVESGPVLVTRELNRGRLETARHALSTTEIVGPRDWTVVALENGTDDNLPAQIRRTWRLHQGVLSSTMAVRRGDDEEWLVRNELRMTRVTADASSSLVGTWKVDLRPTPDAEPYWQTMVIESAKDGNLTGSFYDSAMANGRINADWGAVRIAFSTSDGSGQYHTHGVLRGNRIEGTTLSTGRGFLSYWTAVRER